LGTLLLGEELGLGVTLLLHEGLALGFLFFFIIGLILLVFELAFVRLGAIIGDVATIATILELLLVISSWPESLPLGVEVEPLLVDLCMKAVELLLPESELDIFFFIT